MRSEGDHYVSHGVRCSYVVVYVSWWANIPFGDASYETLSLDACTIIVNRGNEYESTCDSVSVCYTFHVLHTVKPQRQMKVKIGMTVLGELYICTVLHCSESLVV